MIRIIALLTAFVLAELILAPAAVLFLVILGWRF